VYVIYKDTVGLIGPCGLQIATNQKIYHVSINDQTTLSVINNPNVQGAGCAYQDQVLALSAGTKGSYTLPSFIAGFAYTNTLTKCDVVDNVSSLEVENALQISPNPFSQQLNILIPPFMYHKTLFLINSIGEVIQKFYTGNHKLISIPRAQLAAGLYFIRWTDRNNLPQISKVSIVD
jgi:hypothetical protein